MGESGYTEWRYQVLSIVASLGWKKQVSQQMAGEAVTKNDGSTALDDGEQQQLQVLHGAVVPKLSGEALQHVVNAASETIGDVIRVLDAVWLKTSIVTKMGLLNQLLTEKWDEKDCSLDMFLGNKLALAKQRIQSISIDELVLLSVTTTLPSVFEQTCAQLRSDPNVDYNMVKTRVLEYQAGRKQAREELPGNVMAQPAGVQAENSGAGKKKKLSEMEKMKREIQALHTKINKGNQVGPKGKGFGKYGKKKGGWNQWHNNDWSDAPYQQANNQVPKGAPNTNPHAHLICSKCGTKGHVARNCVPKK